MILIYKNRGILVPVFLFTSMVGTIILYHLLKEYVGEVINKIPIEFIFFFGFEVAAIWTYLVKDEYYLNTHGEKVMMDEENSFFWIPLEYWAYIFSIVGIGLLISIYIE